MKVLLAFFLLPILVSAQEKPAPKPAAAPPADTVLHDVRLRSGSVLVGTLQPAEIRVTTAFGPQTIPVADVVDIRFGRRSDTKRYKALRAAISALGSSDAEVRKKAHDKLVAEGAYGAGELAEASKSSEDPEVRRACKEILDSLEIDEKSYVPRDDEIETTHFTMRGSIDEETFTVVVPELGPLHIDRGDILGIRSHHKSEKQEFDVPGRYASMANQWLDTKIDVDPDTVYHITANGRITYPNWGNNSFTPAGSMRFGQINGWPMGSLVGRVGSNGQMFRIGNSFVGGLSGKGTLQIAILSNMGNQPSSGTYHITIKQ